MSKNKGIRRKNDLNPLEVDIATTPEDVHTVTFDEAVSRFITDGERRGLREATIKYYRNELRQFRRWLVKQDRIQTEQDYISRIVRTDVNNYVDYLRHDRGCTNNSINTRLRAMRAFFNFIRESDVIRNNPMKAYPLLKVRKGNIETVSMGELRRLFNAADKRTFTGYRDYTYMLLLLETGVRLSESQAIFVEDVKFSEGVIFIRHTKNQFHRYVPIQSKMKEVLKRYIAIRGTSRNPRI